MELRSRTRQQLRRAVITAALGTLIVPATAGAAAVKTPVITKVTPKNVSVGETLVVNGKNFRRGKAKNTLLFKRDGGKALFVKTGVATKTKIIIAVPKSLEKYMAVKDGKPTATRFRLRVLTTKLGKKFTAVNASPIVGPEKLKADGGGGSGTAVLDPAADCDGDGLLNAFEEGVIKTFPCTADTDGDGATDGYEYASAVDLNNDDYRQPTASLPYPGKRPYPNALDPNDLNTDFDGDGLRMWQEYDLWRLTVQNGASPALTALTYSDGLKFSVYGRDAQGRRVPALVAAGYDKAVDFRTWLTASGYGTIVWPDMTASRDILDFDRSGTVDTNRLRGGLNYLRAEDTYLDTHSVSGVQVPDGMLSDDERDEDADGLSNWSESSGYMLSSWWKGVYNRETPYVIPYAGTDAADADSDGDGVRDGADDQDHDDVPNLIEQSRKVVTGRLFDDPDLPPGNGDPSKEYGRVNPFNPCLPFIYSRTCPTYIPFDTPWAPFDYESDPDYLVLN